MFFYYDKNMHKENWKCENREQTRHELHCFIYEINEIKLSDMS